MRLAGCVKTTLTVWVCATGCRPAPAAAPPEPREAPGSSDGGLIEPRRTVEVVELSIPLFEGGVVELARFRGQVVVLEVSASYARGWTAMHRRYQDLLQAHGEDALSVITVALDMDAGDLAAWERDPPPFTLGWDPQGALAARLGVTSLPTVFVLDHEGGLVDELKGWSDDLETRLESAVGSVLEPRAVGAVCSR